MYPGDNDIPRYKCILPDPDSVNETADSWISGEGFYPWGYDEPDSGRGFFLCPFLQTVGKLAPITVGYRMRCTKTVQTQAHGNFCEGELAPNDSSNRTPI